jgi:hypothetical protein
MGCEFGVGAPDTVAQKWRNIDVRVETRPSPPQSGPLEFLVILTDDQGHPAWSAMVEIRTSDTDDWKQCIQDGRVGVFRRSAVVNAGSRSVVQVQIHYQNDTTVLRFPIKLSTVN